MNTPACSQFTRMVVDVWVLLTSIFAPVSWSATDPQPGKRELLREMFLLFELGFAFNSAGSWWSQASPWLLRRAYHPAKLKLDPWNVSTYQHINLQTDQACIP